MIVVVLIADLAVRQLARDSGERSVIRFYLEDLEIVLILAVLRLIQFFVDFESVHSIFLGLICSSKTLIAGQMLRESTDIGRLYLLTASDIVAVNLGRLLVMALFV